jgi:hypothetical protein
MAKLARRDLPTRARSSSRSAFSQVDANEDRPVVVPTATAYIDLADWDACAERLGGSSNALLAGLAAKLAQKFGRVRLGDNMVTLTYPVSDRTENDFRANALTGIDFMVDPAPVTEDLRQVRRDIKQALTSGLGKFKEQERVLPLTILVPKTVLRKLSSRAVRADLPVGCSYFGDIDPVLACPDGTEADFVSLRMLEQNLTEKSPELIAGELFLGSGRICGKLFITFRAYQPGIENTRHVLREVISGTLADFDLTGVIE